MAVAVNIPSHLKSKPVQKSMCPDFLSPSSASPRSQQHPRRSHLTAKQQITMLYCPLHQILLNSLHPSHPIHAHPATFTQLLTRNPNPASNQNPEQEKFNSPSLPSPGPDLYFRRNFCVVHTPTYRNLWICATL